MITRRTLRAAVHLEGLGLHSGIPVRVSVHPGEKGIRFRFGSSIIEAKPENVTDTRRCTKLGEVSTVEHLMSALAGCEITDAEIEIDAPELPGLDGSAAPYVKAIQKVGAAEIGEQKMPELFSRVFLQEDGIKIAISKGAGEWNYTYDTPDRRWPHTMRAESHDVVRDYEPEIAAARTFALTEEVPAILASGLGKGLKEGEVLILGQTGYENPPRFENEPARHKLLDLIGDLYLSGVPIRHLNVSAQRSGHRTNVAAAMQLKQAIQR